MAKKKRDMFKGVGAGVVIVLLILSGVWFFGSRGTERTIITDELDEEVEDLQEQIQKGICPTPLPSAPRHIFRLY